ncbi:MULTISPECIES: asparaginase [unclassified Roseateles]|uniref:asparaginase n=1 Tax=unclassified Roseateles TaxID=2626991 RepID=UPI0006FFA77B|nr:MULTISPECIES: asparaginase [unclassified Roseateles]KQW44939.1 asparaginase [Pelomonas sp. Root405]KRA70299.1 asparaginase [Pelomonas sp. Root662]
MNPVLIEVMRGSAVESQHAGALAIVDSSGAVHTALGDIERPIFPRSAVKLLQALPLVASGAADAFELTDAELSLACASHSGEPEHVATAAGVLAKLGLTADALECGTQWPGREPVLRCMLARGEVASALHNNCSGKHSGFVCVACLMARNGGADAAAFARGYIAAEHPVMREVSGALSAATGIDVEQAPRGIDGCSIPTFALPLRSLALAFARCGTGQGLSDGNARAARRLRQAVAAAPFMVGGTDRFDTLVMQALGERLFCKIGAEGVYCAALPELGLGVALKIDDGAVRAAEAAFAAVAQALLKAESELLRSYSHLQLRNWRGLDVGALRPAPALTGVLRAA